MEGSQIRTREHVIHANPEICFIMLLDPLAKGNVMNILLGQTASKHLRASGAECFTFVGKDTDPGDPARWVILLQPVPLAVAAAATTVLLGKARAAHTKPASA